MKEWIKAARPANGPAGITVTVSEDNVVAKYSVKSYGKTKAGVDEARSGAKRLLAELQEAIGEAG